MNINFSKNLDYFESGIFNILEDRRKDLISKGKKVYNLSVGTPDFKPDKHVIDALLESAKDPDNWKYSLGDSDELVDSIINYYRHRFNVNLTKNEVTSVYGSQEGISHIGLTFINKGDTVLVPNPGYPIFEIGPFLNGAKIEYYDLLENNNYLPDLKGISKDILKNTKFMIVSYPLNPVCKVAPDSFYKELIAFAKENNIIIIHDNAYSDIIYDGKTSKSFLSFEGAKDVGIEFYSLSKSFNITGARVSFALGNETIINNFKKIRSQIDYGIFTPIQKAAIAALNGPKDSVKAHCLEYEKRRNALCEGLRNIGLNIKNSEGTMFAWAKIPDKFQSSNEFCLKLMEQSGVICTPGSAFGTLGEGYVRFALVLPVPEIIEAIKSIDNCKILK